MDQNEALGRDSQVQQLDEELARLEARVERLRQELAAAEEELRQCRDRDMLARRAVLTEDPSNPPLQ